MVALYFLLPVKQKIFLNCHQTKWVWVCVCVLTFVFFEIKGVKKKIRTVNCKRQTDLEEI